LPLPAPLFGRQIDRPPPRGAQRITPLYSERECFTSPIPTWGKAFFFAPRKGPPDQFPWAHITGISVGASGFSRKWKEKPPQTELKHRAAAVLFSCGGPGVPPVGVPGLGHGRITFRRLGPTRSFCPPPPGPRRPPRGENPARSFPSKPRSWQKARGPRFTKMGGTGPTSTPPGKDPTQK